MTTLKTPEETAEMWTEDEEQHSQIRCAVTVDRQATAQVLCDLLEGERITTMVGIGLYEDEKAHNAAIEQAQALIRQTLDPISSNEC